MSAQGDSGGTGGQEMNDFREYLLGLGLADQTVRNYVAKCRLAREWADEQGVDLTDLKPSQLRQLAELVPNSHSSRRHLRTALSYYWTFKGVSGGADAIRVPRKPPPFPKAIPYDDADAVVAAGRRLSAEPPHKGLVVPLGFYAGFRREEIAWSRWEWFDRRLEWVKVLGKGGRTRHVPVHPDLRSWLRPYYQPVGYVFPGWYGRSHITPATVNKWFGELCEEAGVEGYTPHQMRHTFAQRVYDATGDLYVVQELLGHADPATTQIYAHVSAMTMVRAVQAIGGYGRHLSVVAETRETPTRY